MNYNNCMDLENISLTGSKLAGSIQDNSYNNIENHNKYANPYDLGIFLGVVVGGLALSCAIGYVAEKCIKRIKNKYCKLPDKFYKKTG